MSNVFAAKSEADMRKKQETQKLNTDREIVSLKKEIEMKIQEYENSITKLKL